jgi:hypothetical protein
LNAASLRLFAPGGHALPEPVREPEPLAILSHGLGQDSSALGYMLVHEPALRERYAPGRLIVLSSDTGNEHAEFYENMRYQERFFAGAGIPFELITADRGYHAEKWLSLEHFYASGDRIGSKSYPKTCSSRLKIDVVWRRIEALLHEEYRVSGSRKRGIREYVELTGEKITLLIGFTAEEADRRIKKDEDLPAWFEACVERVYPLRDLGLTRADCREYIREKGHPPVYPSFCRFCPFSTPFDVYHQWRFDRASHDRWAQLERNKLRKFAHLPPEKNHGVFPGKTLDEVLEEAKEEFGHLSDQEMREQRMRRGHAVASKF